MHSARFQLLLTLAALFLSGCAHGLSLTTVGTGPAEISGRYTLFLHGGRYAADLQNVAVLDREGDPYTFSIYAPKFDYRVEEGLDAREAVRRAEAFVRRHYAAVRSEWRKIVGPAGEAIGFELRPLYSATETGYPDILDITYSLRDREVSVRIAYKPEIERGLLNEEVGPFIFRGPR